MNKADLGAAARRTARELSSALRAPERATGSWQPPVLLVSARDGTGVDALLDALAAHRAHALAAARSRAPARAAREHVVSALAQRYGSYGLARIGGAAAVRRRDGARSRAPRSPRPSCWRRGEDALRKPE